MNFVNKGSLLAVFVNEIRMNVLKNNPYRQLGVYTNSPTKERLANHNRMKAFLKVGKSVSFSLDLPQYLQPINRTDALVADADAKLALPKDQMFYALFWFIKTTPLDDIAFNHLIAGERSKAEEIWQKKETLSSLQNRIVCALMCDDYKQALSCAETLYANMEYVNQFVSAVIGTGGNVDVTNLPFTFLDALCEEIDVQKILPHIENSIWKKHISGKAINPLIDTIQNAIAIAKKSKGKGDNVQLAKARLSAGKSLMESTKEGLLQLRNYLSTSDLQYQMIADKLAQEILQCGIDYFNNTNDDDAPQQAMFLQNYALSIAVGTLVKQRCKENIDTLKNVGAEYIVRNELSRLVGYVQDLRSDKGDYLYTFCLGKSITDIREIITKCIPDLETIKRKMGTTNDLYIKISSTVVSSAVNAIVETINKQQTFLMGDAEKLSSIISSAILLMRIIGNMDMDSKSHDYYRSNNSTLLNIYSRLNQSNSGCYIATMAYGNYDHPQVVILRHFRDMFLSQRQWGRWFITYYYRYSPKLVERLKDHALINKFIRKVLDGFILFIKHKYE